MEAEQVKMDSRMSRDMRAEPPGGLAVSAGGGGGSICNYM